MARFPCDADQQRYPGKQRSLYFTTYLGDARDSHLFRLCSQHLAETYAVLTSNGELLEDVSKDSNMTCPVCGAEGGEGYWVMTAYAGDEPVKWCGAFCARCWPELLSTCKLPPDGGERRD